MKRQLILWMLAVATAASGEVESVLERFHAPGQEYVGMPASYVIQQLEKTARGSGDPELGGFMVEIRMDGVAEERVNINMEGMNLRQALQATAAATGAHLLYENGHAVLLDPADAAALAPPPITEESDDASTSSAIENVSFTDIDNALVFVETGVGRGSAFVATMDGKSYIFSNQHNFMGATKLELRAMHGGLLEYDSFEFCRDRDLVRFGLKPGQEKGLAVLSLADDSPGIGDRILVYGNSAGGNVATELKGKVLGVGPADIEIDADIVSGNSGSPIIDSAGRVLGVATYVTFELRFQGDDARKQIFKGTRFNKARRYGVRIPSDGWKEDDLRTFLDQSYLLTDSKNMLEIMNILIMYWNSDKSFAPAAQRIISAYDAGGARVKPPYDFHDPKIAAEVAMLVKSFARNYDELREKVRDMNLDRRELERLKSSFGQKSTNKAEMIDNHIRTSLLNRLKRMQDELGTYTWMSRFLKDSAEPLDELAGELIRILSTNENPYPRIKELM
jgi:hypothetical protein